MNNLSITGNICQDIELKYTTNNKEYLNNTIAVKREYKDKNGEYISDFFDIAIFGGSAKYLSQYGKKGSKVGIVGRIQQDKWEAQDGGNRSKVKIVVNSLELLDPRQQEPQTKEDKVEYFKTEQQDLSNTNLPF